MTARQRTLSTALAISAALALAITTSGCAKDPSETAPKAEVGAAKATAPKAAADPKPAAAAPAAKAAPSKRASVALKGTVGFVGSKVTGSHSGIFKTWSGTVEMGDTIESATLTFSADVASVFSDPDNRGAWSEKLDGHLKSPDFFDAAKFPKASFKSTAIAKAAKGPGTHTITGDLTMRGVTRSVTFPATVTRSGKAITAKAEFTIQRGQWGINFKGKADDLIRDGVVLKIDVQGAR
ncbi:MAG: YceI family protein [Myxococcota bacterium]